MYVKAKKHVHGSKMQQPFDVIFHDFAGPRPDAMAF